MNTGTVYRKTTGTYFVQTGGQLITCAISSRLRKQLIYPTAAPASNPHQRVQVVADIEAVDPIAVGDQVAFDDNGDGTGLIHEVLPRRNRLTRRAPGKKPLEQVIVANIDQVAVVFAAAQPKPKWNLLDRYLVSAEASEVPALILVTKLDLVRGTRAEAAVLDDFAEYDRIGYPVIHTSTADGTGVTAARAALDGRITALVGMSGVGKSSLLNAIEPGLGLRVNQINLKIDKGRHTTSHLEMFELETLCGAVVDTPGMKQFGLWDLAEEDIAPLYIELHPYIGQCKFGLSCTHEHEPGCAVREAVEDGHISERRYTSYLHLRQSIYAEY